MARYRKLTCTKEIIQEVSHLAREGYTDKEIYVHLNIGSHYFHKWKKDVPEFAEALKRNKLFFDRQVEEALFKKAIGYEYEETEMTISKDGTNGRKKVVKKYYPADTAAMIFWLKNRQPKRWRDRIENENINSNKNINYDLTHLSVDELRKIVDEDED